ncbi:Amidohydrolase family protein [Roseateles sp. YR242]|uniref:amidohydrolase family protein n=1 Tax=Roseateles sp. YR242 TaxID=1855305 RepID=UPI0008D0B934|nr:amidohydrolase family protein [Roseateles sp. YR242]SEK87891.1 Amidohydrolase family protein [Roseateles sp. YR242]
MAKSAGVWALAVVLALSALPALARDDQVQIHGLVVGTQHLKDAGAGAFEADYAFSERGRGDQLQARWRLDARGLPVAYEVSGNDYWKVPLTERFSVEGAQATWHSRVEQGSAAWPTQGAFYLPANAPPEFMGVLVRALRRAPGQRLALLPAGEAWLDTGAQVQAGARRLTLYRVGGIEFTPVPVWLDDKGETAAVVDDWFEVLTPTAKPVLAQLQAAQRAANDTWHAALAARLTHQPKGALLIRNARVFDPRDLVVRSPMRVLVRGEHIVRVDPEDNAPVPEDAEVMDAAGRFLMPGLWDVHQHFSGVDGVFDLIAGVTSGRDMANDNVPLMARVQRFDAGTELGPRVVLAGIVEGTGALAGPTDVRIETLDQARKAVDWYADHGYEQIKIYSSFKPELVRPIADMAHARGLRVSGHVPAFMRAQGFIEAGADEIQHLSFLVLNFFPEVQETRSKDRYTVAAEKLSEFRLDDPRWTAFLELLRSRHTVLDPTLVTLEGLFSGDPGQAAPGLRSQVQRFPLVVRRRLLSGAVVVPAGKEAVYREALPALKRMLKSLHDAGVPLMPGSDAFAGYSLQRELELYVQAGIPAAEVLRLATLTPAEVLGVAGQRGVVAPGKQADLVLIDGDPTTDITDVRRVWRTIRGGRVHDPAALEQAMGMAPRAR